MSLFIISAPSGSGKTTLTNELRRIMPGLEFSISYTTRARRGSEQNGREYFFVTREEFDDMERRGEFLEHAVVFGNCYGTAKRFLQEAHDSGMDLLLDIDVQGAAQVKKTMPDAVSIFILPPSRQVLEWRLRNRSHHAEPISEEVIERRLHTATKEIENYSKYDYILVNDRLEESVDLLKAIVLSERAKSSGGELSAEQINLVKTAERCRLENQRDRIKQILATFNL